MTREWNSVRRYFDRAAVVHVATLMPDGAPHSVPVWVGVDDEHLVFFTTADSRKDTALQRDSRVAFSVTNPEEPLDMAFVRGEAVERLTGDAAWAAIDTISRKYTGEPYPRGEEFVAFRIRPTVAWANDYSAA